MKKEISMNVRIPKELHEKIKTEAINQSVKTNELITVSHVIREILDKKFK